MFGACMEFIVFRQCYSTLVIRSELGRFGNGSFEFTQESSEPD